MKKSIRFLTEKIGQPIKEEVIKDRKILDADDVSLASMFNHSTVNFIYGFLAGAVPSAISLEKDLAIFTSALIFYVFLSIIINRPKYETKLGKFILFPVSSATGLYFGYLLIKTFL